MFHDFEHSILWLNLNCIEDNHVLEFMLQNLQNIQSEVVCFYEIEMKTKIKQ